jgi:uncharacterized membrane protein YgdD (TMEM256/DUF423 family)
MLSLFLVIAGVFGAAGIALAAAGAHAAPGAGLDNAANMLLFHALAILGGTALLLQGMLSRQLAVVALAAWALGTVLFSGDVALRVFLGQRLFPMAAPIGGIVLILAWLVLAAAALAKTFDHFA